MVRETWLLLAHSYFQTESLSWLNYLKRALIQEKQAAAFKMYSNTLFLDFKFFNNILLH